MTPKLPEVVEMLLSAPAGSRTLDGHVAAALGWRRRLESYSDPETGVDRNHNYWLAPNETTPIICPAFTSSFQAAFELISGLLPDAAVACNTERGITRVAINDSENVVYAATPALALCAATLRAKR